MLHSLTISLLALGGFHAAPGEDFCLQVGPDFETISAEPTEARPELQALVDHALDRYTDELERWYESEDGRVIYCRIDGSDIDALLMERRSGDWRVVNRVFTTID